MRLTPALRLALLVIAAYAALLLTMGATLPPEVFRPVFSETGPFERMSIALWVVLALALWWPSGLTPRLRLMSGLLALAFAAREADLHKAYTSMSLTKIKFYLSPEIGLVEKLLAGLALLAVVALLVLLARALVRYLVHGGGWRSSAGQLVLLPVLLLPTTKIIDRFSSQLYELWQIVLPVTLGQLVGAIEEGIETAMPLLFLVALVLHRLERRGTATPAG